MKRVCIALLCVLPLLSVQALIGQTSPAPSLTDTDRLRQENYGLKRRVADLLLMLDACTVEAAPLRRDAIPVMLKQEAEKLKAAIESAHEGYVFNLETGQLEPKPAGAPATKP